MLTEREVFLYEQLQDKLIEETTEQNYLGIIMSMQAHENVSALDVSMYIAEISSRKYSGLKEIILPLLEKETDVDVIEDLEIALKNLD